MSEFKYTEVEIANYEVVLITPEVANRMLDRNTGNRSIRASVARRYAEEMKRGSWRETGDPIRVSVNGNLIDGQHRLHAITLSGVPLRAPIITLRRKDDAYAELTAIGLPIDDHSKRQAHDIIGEDAKHVAVARQLMKTMGKHHTPRKEVIKRVIDHVRPHLDEVLSATNRKKVAGHAAVIAAIVLRRVDGWDYTKQIRAVSLDRFNEITPLWMSWYRQCLDLLGHDGGSDTRERAFVYTWAVTDPEKQASGVTMLQIRGDAGYRKYLSDARETFNEHFYSVIREEA